MTIDENLTALVPWNVDPRHQQHFYLAMLRHEARRRGGGSLTPEEVVRLERWLREVRSLNAVVYYDRETLDGWFLVPRLAEDDDLVRRSERTAA